MKNVSAIIREIMIVLEEFGHNEKMEIKNDHEREGNIITIIKLGSDITLESLKLYTDIGNTIEKLVNVGKDTDFNIKIDRISFNSWSSVAIIIKIVHKPSPKEAPGNNLLE